MAKINGQDRSIINKTKRLSFEQKLLILNTVLSIAILSYMILKHI